MIRPGTPIPLTDKQFEALKKMQQRSSYEKIEQLLEQIAFSLERSASAAEATHKLYKKATEATERHMETRTERERESNDRQKEDFLMAKERHELFVKEKKLDLEFKERMRNGTSISNQEIQEGLSK